MTKTSLLLLLIWSTTAPGYKEMGKIDVLPPMSGPDTRAVGWEWHYIDEKGNNGLMRKTADSLETASYWRSDGCSWTRVKKGFAPAIKWENCPSSGQSVYQLTGDVIWPLQVGNMFKYTGTATSTLFKREKKFSRKCRIKKQVKIKTNAGEFDTFKVVCKDKWITRTWWLAPEIGTAVAYKQRSKIGEGYSHEMTRIVTPDKPAD